MQTKTLFVGMKNLEIKARIYDFNKMKQKLQDLTAQNPTTMQQTDIFYNVNQGRLKLRIFDNQTSELIEYTRPNQAGPKVSTYSRVALNPYQTEQMKHTLSKSCGVKVIVKKTRFVYMVDTTRIHLDQVQDLGNFIEFEVVGFENLELAQKTIDDLFIKLELANPDLVEEAYADISLLSASKSFSESKKPENNQTIASCVSTEEAAYTLQDRHIAHMENKVAQRTGDFAAMTLPFTFEYRDPANKYAPSLFNNCTFLQKFGSFNKGNKVSGITFEGTFYIWGSDNTFEEIFAYPNKDNEWIES